MTTNHMTPESETTITLLSWAARTALLAAAAELGTPAAGATGNEVAGALVVALAEAEAAVEMMRGALAYRRSVRP